MLRRTRDLTDGPECEYVTTGKGRNALVHNGFMFGTNSTRPSKNETSRVYWRCIFGGKTPLRCKATAITVGGRIVKISPTDLHSHPPDYAKVEARRVLDVMKMRAATEETPVEQIYQDTVGNAVMDQQVAVHVPTAHITAKRLRRVRKKIRTTMSLAGVDEDFNWLLSPADADETSQNQPENEVDEMNFRITPCTSRTGTVRSVTGTIRTVTGIARTYPVHSRPINSALRSYVFVNMMPWRKLNCLVAATLTPMHSDGSVNVELIPRYVEHLFNNGIRYIFINGTAGESMSLTVSERKLLAEKWMSAAKGKLAGVIVHVGANNLRETQELAVHAENYGCLAISSMAPAFFKPKSVNCLINYCSEVAKAASKTPFIYYHFPAMNGVDINMTDFLTEAVSHIPSLVGVKFTSSDLADATQACLLFDKKFEIFYGGETAMLGGLSMGIRSYIGGSFSLVGRPCKRLVEAFDIGDWEQSRSDQYKIQQFFRNTHKMGDFQGMIAAFKAVLTCSGLDVGPPRNPIRSLAGEDLLNMEKNLEAMRYNAWVQ